MRAWGAIVAVLMMLALSACAGSGGSAEPTAPATVQRLRVGNLSDQPIEGLVVRFPGSEWDSPTRDVEFGDVGPGELSEYVEVPGGVYRYAAYRYVLDGAMVDQPVMDWMGEVPMAGRAFTYELSLDTRLPPGGQIRLVKVTVDEE